MARHNTRSMDDNVNYFQDALEDGDIDVAKTTPDTPKSDDNTKTESVDHDGYKHLAMYDYFGVNANDENDDDTEMLRNIAEHLHASDKQSIEDELMDIEYRIGKPKLGISRMRHILNYLTLMGSAKEAMEGVKKYENLGRDKN